jgi:hypothetical protein
LSEWNIVRPRRRLPQAKLLAATYPCSHTGCRLKQKPTCAVVPDRTGHPGGKILKSGGKTQIGLTVGPTLELYLCQPITEVLQHPHAPQFVRQIIEEVVRIANVLRYRRAYAQKVSAMVCTDLQKVTAEYIAVPVYTNSSNRISHADVVVCGDCFEPQCGILSVDRGPCLGAQQPRGAIVSGHTYGLRETTDGIDVRLPQPQTGIRCHLSRGLLEGDLLRSESVFIRETSRVDGPVRTLCQEITYIDPSRAGACKLAISRWFADNSVLLKEFAAIETIIVIVERNEIVASFL